MSDLESRVTLGDILNDLNPGPAAYLSAARTIEAGTFDELRPLSVAILSTFTSDLLRPYLVVEGAARGILAEPYFGPFNQLEQQVLDADSALYQSDPDVVVIATRIEEMAPDLVNRFITLGRADVEGHLGQIESRLHGLIEGLREHTTAAVLVFNYAGPIYLAAGLADASLDPPQVSVSHLANQRVADVCKRFPDAHVFDYAGLVHELGLRSWYDPKLWYLGRIPFGAQAQLETGRRLSRYLRAISFAPCKCLVIDLDNTLWGGVVGEDGVDGIALGEDYPGNVYKDFQRKLSSLRDQGVLLAIASKNNESDALEVFQQHSDSILRVEDFAAREIHWLDKATSLASIATTLNISTDALAFFDDSPVEREWVRTKMPEVTVIDVPDSPLGFVDALEESGAFDKLTISAEDRRRPEMYQHEQVRGQLQAQSASLEDFIRQLDVKATIGYASKESLPRIAQLLTKTNQFNLTTRRHASSEIQAMIDSGAIALSLRVADRFGDSGLVGVAIGVPGESSRWTIDTFLMSCRVIGRHAETALLSTLSAIVCDRGGRVLVGEYIPTAKNGLASGFYSDHGFEPADGDGMRWEWELSGGGIPPPEFVVVSFEDRSDNGG